MPNRIPGVIDDMREYKVWYKEKYIFVANCLLRCRKCNQEHNRICEIEILGNEKKAIKGTKKCPLCGKTHNKYLTVGPGVEGENVENRNCFPTREGECVRHNT